MSFISRFLGLGQDPREELRPLWHGVVATSREKAWYADCGAKDSVEGRFDMITLVLALVLLRMEKSADLAPKTALLTELFVEDMDRQLRDTGVGDLMVGKHIGKLMSVVGGRIGALRDAMRQSDAMMAEILARNVMLADENKKPYHLAVRLRALAGELAGIDDATLLTGALRA